jgi:hypothetical protein
MRSNEIALHSQQLSEQTGARTADALSQQSEAWRHLPDVVTGFQRSYGLSQQIQQQAQAHQAEILKSSSELALDELKRKQAAEELQWAQQLHQTDMLQYQKDAMKAETDLRIAQAQKARAALSHDVGYDDLGAMTPERLANIVISTGTKFIPGRGGADAVPANEQEIQNAKDFLKQKRIDQMMEHALQGAYAGYVPDLETGYWKKDQEAAKAAMENYQASHSRFGNLGDLDEGGFGALGAQSGAAPQQVPTGAISPETIKSDAYVDKLVTDFYSRGVAVPNMTGSSFNNWKFATPEQKARLISTVRSMIQSETPRQIAKHPEFRDDPKKLDVFVRRYLEATSQMPEVIRIMHPQ